MAKRFEEDFTTEKDIPGKMQVSKDAFCVGKMMSLLILAIGGVAHVI